MRVSYNPGFQAIVILGVPMLLLVLRDEPGTFYSMQEA